VGQVDAHRCVTSPCFWAGVDARCQVPLRHGKRDEPTPPSAAYRAFRRPPEVPAQQRTRYRGSGAGRAGGATRSPSDLAVGRPWLHHADGRTWRGCAPPVGATSSARPSRSSRGLAANLRARTAGAWSRTASRSTERRKLLHELRESGLCLRIVLAGAHQHTEGYRKLWARLRFAGVRTSPRRMRRVMRENGLLAPKAESGPLRDPSPSSTWAGVNCP
jgi:HTH-like domain